MIRIRIMLEDPNPMYVPWILNSGPELTMRKELVRTHSGVWAPSCQIKGTGTRT